MSFEDVDVNAVATNNPAAGGSITIISGLTADSSAIQVEVCCKETYTKAATKVFCGNLQIHNTAKINSYR